MNSLSVALAGIRKVAIDVSVGSDPFAANYTNQSIQPMSAPPGSIEAQKRDQEAQKQQQAEADMKAQEAEVKQRDKQLQDAQNQQQKMMSDYQKTQAELAQTKAKVDAFEARDAVTSPGLSPSFEAQNKRMQNAVKSLASNSSKYNGAMTLMKASHYGVKRALFNGIKKLPKPEQIILLTKIASQMNAPSTGMTQPKTITGQNVPSALPGGGRQGKSLGGPRNQPKGPPLHQQALEQVGRGVSGLAQGYHNLKYPADPNRPVIKTHPRSFGGGEPITSGQIGNVVNSLEDATLAVGRKVVNGAKDLGRTGLLWADNKAQKGVNTAIDALTPKFELEPAQPAKPEGFEDRFTSPNQMLDAYGAADDMSPQQRAQYDWLVNNGDTSAIVDDDNWWSNIGSEYRAQAEDPHGYARGGFMEDDFFTNLVNKRWGEKGENPAREGTIGHSLYGLADKFVRGNMGALDAIKNPFSRGANYVAGGLAGLGVGSQDIMSGAGAATGGLLDFAKDFKNKSWGERLDTDWSELSNATRAGREKMGEGLGMMGRGVGNQAKGMAHLLTGGLVFNPKAPKQKPTPATPAAPPSPPPGQQPIPGAPEGQTYPQFSGAFGNPGFAQNVNNYSGWANAGHMPQSWPSLFNPNAGIIQQGLGQLFGGMALSPNYRQTMQGQNSFRNSPRFSPMNDAMTAFGRSATGPMMFAQNNAPPALSTYGYGR